MVIEDVEIGEGYIFFQYSLCRVVLMVCCGGGRKTQPALSFSTRSVESF